MANLAINGAAGRMGRRLVSLAEAVCPELTLGGAIEHAGHELLGQSANVFTDRTLPGPTLSTQWSADIDVAIDFTIPAGTREAIRHAVDVRAALVIGTTGLTTEDHAAIDAAAKSIAILQAPNMSLGVNLLFALAGQVAARLGDDYDIEIVEAHHRMKKDAPSGTALGIAEAICATTGKQMDKDLVHGRHGDDVTRQRGQIGMHAVRSGDVVGRHTVSFGAIGEELQLTHIASTRDVFARGALRAASWLVGKPAGRYGMADVLGLT